MGIDLVATAATPARYNRLAPIYDVMEFFSERRFKPWRQRLWSLVPGGRVLEVGVGTGKNMPYYPASAEVTAVDLSDRMLAQAHRRAAQEGVNVELHEMDAQDLRFEDGSFDTVVATFVRVDSTRLLCAGSRAWVERAQPGGAARGAYRAA